MFIVRFTYRKATFYLTEKGVYTLDSSRAHEFASRSNAELAIDKARSSMTEETKKLPAVYTLL